MSSGIPFQVSVVIPVYRAEKFISRAVDSALAQPEVAEIVLVEDGSPDSSLDMCRQIADQHPGRVRLFRHPDDGNHGAGPTRNLGIQQSRFPFIAFLDADDYYLPGRFARDAELLLADETLDGVYNALGADIQDEAGQRWWAARQAQALTTLRDPPPPETLFFEMGPIGSKGHFSCDTLTVRRRVFDTVQFSGLRLAQDTLLWVQMAALFRLAGGRTRTPVAMRGVHAHNRIQDAGEMRKAAAAVFEQLGLWADHMDLPPPKRRAIQQAQILTCTDWFTLIANLRRNTALLRHPRTYAQIFRWAAIRHYPDDPFLPGLFPSLRRATNQLPRA